MTTKVRSILLMAAIMVLASVAVRASDFVLDTASRDQLCKEARLAYDQAQTYLDKVNYLPALDQLVVVSEKQPDMPEAGFLVGNLACSEARKHMGEDAIAILHKAEAAYEKILDIQGLRHADRDRAEAALTKVKASIAGEADRDARIEKVAQDVIKSEKDLVDKLRAARKAEVDAQNALAGGANGAPAAQGAGIGGGPGGGVNPGMGMGQNSGGRSSNSGAVMNTGGSSSGSSRPSNNGGGSRGSSGGGRRG